MTPQPNHLKNVHLKKYSMFAQGMGTSTHFFRGLKFHFVNLLET